MCPIRNVSKSLSLSLSLSKFVSLSLSNFVSICLVQSRAVESYINVCFQLYLSLQLCLDLSSSIESSRKFSLSLQFCIYRSSLIESSRKQILLRKSYREQPQILSKRVQPEMFVSLSIDFSLQFCLYLCNSTESSRKFYRNVSNPKCLFPSQNMDSFNKTCPTRNVCFPLSLYISLSKFVSVCLV
jgi:hypothetical protein